MVQTYLITVDGYLVVLEKNFKSLQARVGDEAAII